MRRRAVLSLLSIGVLAACDTAKLTVPVPAAPPPRMPLPDMGATATRAKEREQLATLAPLGTAAAQPTVTLLPTPVPTLIPAPTVPSTSVPTSAIAFMPVVQTLALVRSGFGQYKTAVGVGFVVRNPDSDHTLENSSYRITAYEEGGVALTTSDGFIEAVLPGQTLGIGTQLEVPSETPIARLAVQLGSGTFATVAYPPPPIIGGATLASGVIPTVRGVLRSTFMEELPQVRASTILYNGVGEIVGGGSVMIPAVPPLGQAVVTVPVIYTGTPLKVELYAALSSRTLRG